jgi:hypothetical protein
MEEMKPEFFYTNATPRYQFVPLRKDVGYKSLVQWLGPFDLHPGDWIDVHSLIQATNENEFTVAWNQFLTLNEYGALFTGQLGWSTGRNLLRDIHHDGLMLSKAFPVEQEYCSAYIASCVTVKPLVGSGIVPTGATLTLNYAELTVKLHRNENAQVL